MECILQEDFEQIYQRTLPWEKLNHKRVLVTGATGLIGSLLLKYMDYLNKCKGMDIALLAVVRNRMRAEEILADVKVQLLDGDIVRCTEWDTQVDYIFHCAAITKSRQMVEHPVEVFESIVTGTGNMLRFAAGQHVLSMVYVSSMEVYGQITDETRRTTEEDVGNIRPLEVRSCYPLGKQAAEHLCYDYYREYGVPVKMARLAQTFGAGILPGEGRVFAQFARSVKDGTDIVLHTDGASMGNYCYTADAVSGLFTLLLEGADGEAYNIANEQAAMTIRQMAQLVADKVAGGRIKVALDIPEGNCYGYAAPTKLRMSARKLNELGWKATRELEEMYSRMLEGKYI